MPVVSTSILVKLQEHTLALQHLDNVVENEVIVLKCQDDRWQPPASLVA